MAEIRLNKYLAEQLGISRREADDAIVAGKVTVNGEDAVLGARIRLPDEVLTGADGSFLQKTLDKIPEVCYNGEIVPFRVGYTYLALNKPTGYVCSRKRQGEIPTLFELLPEKYKSLKTVGRLDKDSEGLILLTNDGDFAFQMTHPSFQKTKVYEVWLDRALEPLHQQMISDFGIELKDGRSQMGLIRLDDSRKVWQVTLTEGRNRQIRRTFGALGYTVVKLKRMTFGKYELGELKVGEFQEVKKA